MAQPPLVLALWTPAYRFTRDALVGIRRYERVARPDWRIVVRVVEWQGKVLPPAMLEGAIGCVGFIPFTESQRQLRDLGIATVTTSARNRECVVSRVMPDFAASGAAAAEHLASRGFRHLAVAVQGGNYWAGEATRGARRAARTTGCEFHGVLAQRSGIAEWLGRLPRPVGIVTDLAFGPLLMEEAVRRGETVPRDIAVVGVEDTTEVCESMAIPMSAVDLDGDRVGYAAAEMLERILRTGRTARETMRIAPGPVTLRQSSDTVVSGDPLLSEAIGYIRRHAGRGVHVDDVAAHVRLVRRTLERLFAKHLHRTPLEEIRRHRYERARELLVSSDAKIAEVAHLCGVADARMFSKEFRKRFQTTPQSYRSSHRRGR